MRSQHRHGPARVAASSLCVRPAIRSAVLRIVAALAAVTVATATGLAPAGPAHAQPVPKPNSHEWWLTDTWHAERDVWPLSQGEGVTVAVIDTGVGGGHYLPPELKGDFILPGVNLADGGPGNFDDNGHGTEMAELIAARGTAGGWVGLAPKSKILPVAVVSGADINKGIRWSVDHGAQVISISMAEIAIGDCSPDQQDAIDYAVEHDVIVVAGAGNSGDSNNNTEAPGSCPGVTAVGAVDRSGQPWGKTQRKPYVAVAAPGVELGLKNNFNESEITSGTSDSTALVSATMALVRAKYPKLPARDVVQRVVGSARDTGPAGRDDTTGYGIVDPARALAQTVPQGAGNPAYDRYDAIKADQKHAADSRHRNILLLKLAGVVCVALVLLALALLIVWSVRRDRRARRARSGGGAPPYPWPPQRPGGLPPPAPGQQPPYGAAPAHLPGSPPYGASQYGAGPAQPPSAHGPGPQPPTAALWPDPNQEHR